MRSALCEEDFGLCPGRGGTGLVIVASGFHEYRRDDLPDAGVNRRLSSEGAVSRKVAEALKAALIGHFSDRLVLLGTGAQRDQDG